MTAPAGSAQRGEARAARRSGLAIAAAWCGGGGLLMAVAGPLAQGAVRNAGIWPWAEFYYLFLWGVLLGPAALVLGVCALHATRRGTRRSGRRLAWLGCGTGALLLAALLVFACGPH